MMMAMPLDQLQAFAAQYMNSPNGGIIVALATQIANAKKSAQISEAPQQPQSSIGQQAVQSMAPREQGIGQLPVDNMEGMAGGGIVGYAGGGEVKHFDGKDDSLVPPVANDPRVVFGSGPSLYDSLAGVYQNVKSGLSFSTRNRYNPAAAVVNPPTPAPVGPAVTNPTDARLASGTQQPPGGIADLMAAVPSIDPKTKAPPKVDDAKKEGTVASDNLYDLLSRNTPSYAGVSQEDISKAMTPEGTLSAADLANQSSEIAKEKDAAANASYQKFWDMSKEDRSRLDKRMDQSPGMALMMAGLGMIKSGNPFEAIASGATAGLKQYADEQKYFDSARRELNHADLLTQTALDARLNNNERDAQKYMDMAQASKENAIRSRLTGIQLLNTSAYQQGILSNQGQELDIKAALLPSEIEKNQASAYGARAMGDYHKAASEAMPNKFDTNVSLKLQGMALKEYSDWAKDRMGGALATDLVKAQKRAEIFSRYGVPQPTGGIVAGSALGTTPGTWNITPG
jgi:hypothetical protein